MEDDGGYESESAVQWNSYNSWEGGEVEEVAFVINGDYHPATIPQSQPILPVTSANGITYHPSNQEEEEKKEVEKKKEEEEGLLRKTFLRVGKGMEEEEPLGWVGEMEEEEEEEKEDKEGRVREN